MYGYDDDDDGYGSGDSYDAAPSAADNDVAARRRAKRQRNRANRAAREREHERAQRAAAADAKHAADVAAAAAQAAAAERDVKAKADAFALTYGGGASGGAVGVVSGLHAAASRDWPPPPNPNARYESHAHALQALVPRNSDDMPWFINGVCGSCGTSGGFFRTQREWEHRQHWLSCPDGNTIHSHRLGLCCRVCRFLPQTQAELRAHLTDAFHCTAIAYANASHAASELPADTDLRARMVAAADFAAPRVPKAKAPAGHADAADASDAAAEYDPIVLLPVPRRSAAALAAAAATHPDAKVRAEAEAEKSQDARAVALVQVSRDPQALEHVLRALATGPAVPAARGAVGLQQIAGAPSAAGSGVAPAANPLSAQAIVSDAVPTGAGGGAGAWPPPNPVPDFQHHSEQLDALVPAHDNVMPWFVSAMCAACSSTEGGLYRTRDAFDASKHAALCKYRGNEKCGFVVPWCRLCRFVPETRAQLRAHLTDPYHCMAAAYASASVAVNADAAQPVADARERVRTAAAAAAPYLAAAANHSAPFVLLPAPAPPTAHAVGAAPGLVSAAALIPMPRDIVAEASRASTSPSKPGVPAAAAAMPARAAPAPADLKADPRSAAVNEVLWRRAVVAASVHAPGDANAAPQPHDDVSDPQLPWYAVWSCAAPGCTAEYRTADGMRQHALQSAGAAHQPGWPVCRVCHFEADSAGAWTQHCLGADHKRLCASARVRARIAADVGAHAPAAAVEMECIVCTEQFAHSAGHAHTPVVLPGCGHTLCDACALRSAASANGCPHCRKPIARGDACRPNYALMQALTPVPAAAGRLAAVAAPISATAGDRPRATLTDVLAAVLADARGPPVAAAHNAAPTAGASVSAPVYGAAAAAAGAGAGANHHTDAKQPARAHNEPNGGQSRGGRRGRRR